MQVRTEDNEIIREGGAYWMLTTDRSFATIPCARAVAVQKPWVEGAYVMFQGVGLGGSGVTRIRVGGVAVGVYASREALDADVAWAQEMTWTIAERTTK